MLLLLLLLYFLQILVVAVSQWVNAREIEMMVTYPPEENTFNARSFDDLADIRRPLKRSICNGEQSLLQSNLNNLVCHNI